MVLAVKRYLRKLVGPKKHISMLGSDPHALTRTQQLFIQWNAERLSIPPEESRELYFASWRAIHGGHASADYKLFNRLSHNMYQVFFRDIQSDLYDAYAFHGPMHFLRMLAYVEPTWQADEPVVMHLRDRAMVDIVDYGCGLAQRSRTLATYIKALGKSVRLYLVDIPTIRKEFLLWLGEQAGIETTFLESSAQTPMPELPACDVCFATEFLEHVYDPVRYFDHMHNALRPNGLLITDVRDQNAEFMHVSPSLQEVREKIRRLKYLEIEANAIYAKASV